MKNKGLLTVLAVFTAVCLWAQPPQAFNYQVVVRNNAGEIITSQQVGIKINIRNGLPLGTIVYQETHAATTNQFGMVNISIGSGTVISGTFTGINWRANPKFLELLVDPAGGTNYVPMGTTELLSVPYALFSQTSSDSYWNISTNHLYYNDGNIGVGTFNPNNSIEINGNDAESGLRVAWGGSFPSLYGEISHAGSGGLKINSNSGGTWADMSFQTNGTTKMFLESAGNLGIGTTTPDNRLVIKSAGAGDIFKILSDADLPLVKFRHTSNNSGALYMYDGSGNNTVFLYGDGNSFINSGSLGLGTSSISNAKLQIEGATTYEGIIKINNTGTSGASFFMGSTNSDWGGGTNQNLFVMGHGAPSSANIDLAINSSGFLGLGTTTPASRLDVRGNVTIRDNTTGNIAVELGTGLDYAEGFNVTNKENIEPGTVLCIDPGNPGNLKKSSISYDTKVAGIVAGANNLGSGIILGRGTHDFNVALAGRVYCNVEASDQPIEVGDLLTTSSLPGFAMKATNNEKAQGAILGKAMEPLAKGSKGKILVLVTLQ